VQALVFHYYICKDRPAEEMLSPPPAVWYASVHTNTGAMHISTANVSDPLFSSSSQQDTGCSMSKGTRLLPSAMDVEKLSSIISFAFSMSTCNKKFGKTKQ